MNIPPMNVPHKLLKEFAKSFKLGKNTLETSYGSFKIKPKIIGVAFGLNASDNALKKLTDEMMSIGIENEHDRLVFKRIFILYIQMAFLLPSTITKIEKITEGNWGAYILNFLIKSITNYRLKKKKLVDRCLYALMIIYFHLAKNKVNKGEEKFGVPWVSNWNREQLVARIRAEIDSHMML
ncbi:hypothetical protein Ahy_B06g081543 [Arachis hypogaea]|uniref:Uncharacterized protein n=1 Tax=Arachis hypogaea TaxID=3818 RepID=A0A444YLE2_ARAHY|nr:hypothetical protein Ahy_B06g081543 [Arachis hypogaea]